MRQSNISITTLLGAFYNDFQIINPITCTCIQQPEIHRHFNSPRINFSISTIIAVLFLTNITSASSAEWKVDPTIQLRTAYNDNIRLNVDNKISSSEITLIPSTLFSLETPNSGVSGNLRFDFRRYLQESKLNDNNARLRINSFRRMERSKTDLNISLIRDTTLDSQLEETGLVFDRVNRFLKRINPTWTYNISDRTSLETGYTFTDVSYEKSNTGFVDYASHNGQLTLKRVLNERTYATATLGSSLTNNDNDVTSTYSYLQGGGSYQFSDTLSASLFAGVRRTRSEFKQQIPIFSGGFFVGFAPVSNKVNNSSWGAVFNGSLSKRFERGSSSLSVSRDISNTISGVLFEVTRLTWSNSYRFSETLSGNLGLTLYRSRDDSKLSTSQDRKFYDINPQINWDFAQFWRISASYRYRNQSFDSSNDNATQNVADLTLTYRWPRIAVSR